MARFTADELQTALAPCVVTDSGETVEVESVSTDTRTLTPGALFIALRGEHFDGHQFVGEARRRGARACVLQQHNRNDDTLAKLDLPIFWVEDTLVALGNLARFHRRRFAIPIVGIAGAAGKTTTKDITAHLLSQQGCVHKTPGNWNNRVGVPLTLLELERCHTAAVIEIGTNQPGEIAELCRIAEPTHGLITTIAEEHLEFLGSLDGVEQEETALFRWLQQHGGIACINIDDERLRPYVSQLPRSLTYGSITSAQLQARWSFDTVTLYPLLEFCWHGRVVGPVRLQQPGYAAALCGIAAAAAALAVGMDFDAVVQGLASYCPPVPHGYARMQVQHGVGGIVILNDCYNANPPSMRLALQTLAAYPAVGKRIAVLGDMRELGAATSQAHRAVLETALEYADIVVVVGQAMHAAADNFKHHRERLLPARDHSHATEFVKGIARSGDVVLVKGSRALMLERVIEHLLPREQELPS